MKKHIIYTLLLIACSVNLAAQDFIELDGKKIPKEKLNPYSGLGYEVDLTKPENKPSLKSSDYLRCHGLPTGHCLSHRP
jgi:hypothetical protein